MRALPSGVNSLLGQKLVGPSARLGAWAPVAIRERPDGKEASAGGMALEMPQIPQIQPMSASIFTDRSTCSTTRSEYGRDPNRRVAPALSLEQEEALIGLMFDNWMQHQCTTLDYDHVMRCAITLQCNPEVVKAVSKGATAPVPLEQAWRPDDGWITDMAFAFNDADSQLTARSKPMGDITPGGITHVVETGIGGGSLPPPPAGVLAGAGASALNGAETVVVGGPPAKKGKKKKGKSDHVSDAELLADPRQRRSASPKQTGARPGTPKSAPKKGKKRSDSPSARSVANSVAS